jgi:hypothetical protein
MLQVKHVRGHFPPQPRCTLCSYVGATADQLDQHYLDMHHVRTHRVVAKRMSEDSLGAGETSATEKQPVDCQVPAATADRLSADDVPEQVPSTYAHEPEELERSGSSSPDTLASVRDLDDDVFL